MKTNERATNVNQEQRINTPIFLTLPELGWYSNFGGELDHYIREMVPKVEEEIVRHLQAIDTSGTQELYEMIGDHLASTSDWVIDGDCELRTRPLLVLLVYEALDGDWEKALPAAAAVEFLHNFYVIHDDIQNRTEVRGGKPTVWKKVGIAQAINAGDCLFALANIAIASLPKSFPASVTLKAIELISETSVRLAQGNYLDIALEDPKAQTLESYWVMATNKSAALIGLCTELGAILAGKNKTTQMLCRNIGEQLGLACRIQADVLGIWGSEGQGGDNDEGDEVAKTNSLPIIYGLEIQGDFSERWKSECPSQREASKLAEQLESEGARTYAEAMKAQHLQSALTNVHKLGSGKLQAQNALNALFGRIVKPPAEGE